MTVFRPTDAAETAEIVAWAAAERHALEIVGGGSKRALGRPPISEHTLDVSALHGIVDYDPAELVLTARAATPMAEIQTQLDARAQMLAFEPPDWSALFSSDGKPTLGGVMACNLAGPRRVRAGAARDHFLGFAAVNGFGDAWKAGGRVVKNVTGYDMCKLQAGAHGTLSVLTELSVRVLPRPETSGSVVLTGHSDAQAVVAMAAALNSPHEVSAAAHLPADAAARSAVACLAGGASVTVLRLEGPRPSVGFRAAALARELGATARLDPRESEMLWREIASVAALLGGGDSVVWRVCPTPSEAASVMRAARGFGTARGFYDWGGGLLWLAIDAAEVGEDGGAAIVRRAVGLAGGHATMVRAPAELRARVPVFEPPAPGLAALTRRVKTGFDPNAVLNPGRMHEGV